MRLRSYLDNTYIGLIDRKEKSNIEKPREISILIKELNQILSQCYKKRDLKFDLVKEYKSPSEILNIKENKLERVTRRWMRLSEKLEEIKDEHIRSLHEK